MDVISSSSDYALKNSMHQLNGMLSDQIKDMREKILYEVAYIESALDDPDIMISPDMRRIFSLRWSVL